MSNKSIRVFRVQDRKGRGPFKPGVPEKWSDKTFGAGVKVHPPWPEEFGFDLIELHGLPGEHFGSAVVDIGKIREWFSDTEWLAMKRLGYHLVSLRADRILAQSSAQVVFARRKPLSRGAVIVPWPQKERPAP